MAEIDPDEFRQKVRVAERIIRQYGAVMERQPSGCSLFPESELPAPREVVKSAVLLVAVFHILQRGKDPHLTEQARVAYATLAYFVPDETAGRERRFHESTGEAAERLAGKEAPSPEMVEAVRGLPARELEEAAREYEALRKEFDDALAGMIRES